MVNKSGTCRHDDLQKKHFGDHKKEEGKPIKQMYFGDKADKRDPNTINKRKNKL